MGLLESAGLLSTSAPELTKPSLFFGGEVSLAFDNSLLLLALISLLEFKNSKFIFV